MMHRLLDWGIVGEVYQKKQIVLYAIAKITLNNGISAYVKTNTF